MTRVVVLVLLIASLTATATAQAPRPGLSPDERAALVGEFISKWGPAIERFHHVPLDIWTQRMAGAFAAADGTNLQNALKRDTLEGALAELSGVGHRLTDTHVTETYRASPPLLTADDVSRLSSNLLGDLARDLVFTPVQPCRILDTRVAGGPIGANGSRAFLGVAVNAGANFTSQGGSGTDCGVAAVGASGIVINVTAVTPSGAGYATIYQSGTSRPLSASVNYATGAVVNNTVIVRIPNPLAITDFVIYTLAQSDYVADIVGYFSPPQATSLQCTSTAITSNTIAAGATTFFNAAACPAGYMATTPYCYSDATGVQGLGSGINSNVPGLTAFCAWRNTSASGQVVYGGTTCCRVPGR